VLLECNGNRTDEKILSKTNFAQQISFSTFIFNMILFQQEIYRFIPIIYTVNLFRKNKIYSYLIKKKIIVHLQTL